MELVYLWVEKYKNIQKQGFNFSPRFRCEFKDEYDEEGKLKNNCQLIIDEKKDYESIFPENINITAIVGENGSGKSSLLESLIDLFSESSLSWLDDEKYRKYIVIYKYDNSYIYLQKYIDTKIQIIDKNGNKIQWLKKNPNQRLFEWHSELLGLIIQNEVNKKISIESEQIFIEEVQNRDKIKKYMIMNSLLDSKFKKESNKFFVVKNVTVEIKWNNLFDSSKDGYKYDNEVLAEIETKYNEAKQNFEDKKYKDTFINIIDLCEIKIKKLKASGFFEFAHFTQDPYLSNKFRYEKLYNCLSHIKKNQDIKAVYQSVINDLDKYDNFTFKIEELVHEKNRNFIFDLPEYIFNIELKDEDKSFQDLSFGERQLLSQLNFIQFYTNKKKYIEREGDESFEDDDGNEQERVVVYDTKVKSMIVLLDEFEIGLHPNWQKKATNYIIDFLKDIKDIDFNLIVTSHSPFLLSDLPKQNVIFLEKDEQTGNCINASYKVDMNPFGANIHTLLSHGFFMKNGLMGEFAKDKIDTAIKYLNQTKLSEKELEYCENIISIIGEPIIKRQLQKMLDSKRLKKIDEIDKIYDEIEFLKHRLDILRKNQ